MKRKNYPVLLFLLAALPPPLLSACARWERNVTVGGIDYVEYRIVEGESRNMYSIGRLRSEVEIDGIVFKDWLHLGKNGKVAAGYVGKDRTLNGVFAPVNTWVVFDENGILKTCAFPYDMRLGDLAVLGSRFGSEGIFTSFYPGGAVKYFFSPEDIEIGGVPCKGGVFNMIGLTPEGKVKECTLYKPYVSGNTAFPKGARIKLGGDGAYSAE